MPVVGRVGSVGPVAVQQARTGLRQITVPDLIGPPAHGDPFDFVPSAPIEQAQLHPVGMLQEEGEVDAFPVPSRAEGIGLAGPDRPSIPGGRDVRGSTARGPPVLRRRGRAGQRRQL